MGAGKKGGRMEVGCPRRSSGSGLEFLGGVGVAKTEERTISERLQCDVLAAHGASDLGGVGGGVCGGGR